MAKTGGAYRADSFDSTRQQLSDIEVKLPGGSINIDEARADSQPQQSESKQPAQMQETVEIVQIQQPAKQQEQVRQETVQKPQEARQAASMQKQEQPSAQGAQPPAVDMAAVDTSRQPQQASGYEAASQPTIQLESASISSPIFSNEAIAQEREKERMVADAVETESEASDVQEQVEQFDDLTEADQGPVPEEAHHANDKSEAIPLPLNDAPPTMRARSAQKMAKEESLNEVRNKEYAGSALYGKIMGSLLVKPNEIGVGGLEIEEALRLGDSCGVMRYLERNGVDISQIANAEDVARAVNDKNMVVATSKSPVNRGSSAQSRVLRILSGVRGFFLHPIMSKSYNADFDGDDINVSFDESAARRFKNGMSYLMDVDDSVSLDPDFFITGNIDGPYVNGENAIEFFRGSLSSLNLSESDMSKLIESVRELYKQHTSSESLQSLARVITDIAGDGKNRYQMISDLLGTIYDSMRRISVAQADLNSHRRNVSLEDMMPVRNNHDRGLLEVVDGLVDGTIAANFQDFKTALTAYAGEGSKGENIQFRFNSDILKMFRLDSRIYRGEEDLYEIYQHTMKYVMSQKCSNAVFASNESQAASDLIRTAVIKKVGFPRADEPFGAFLTRFVAEYNEWARLINIANTTFDNDMTISRKDEDAVKLIKSRKCGDVAAAFVDIYGDCSMASLFGNVDFVQSDKGNSMWIQANRIKVDMNDYSKTLRQVSKCNRVSISQKELQKKLDIDISSSDALEGLMYSIYDQKNSAAATYSTEMYGIDVDGSGGAKQDKTIMGKLLKVVRELEIVAKKQEAGDRINDYQTYIDELIDLINSVGPDVFAHFEMYDTRFFQSEYGQKMLKAKTAEELGSIFISMQVEMRLDRVRVAMDEVVDMNESETAGTSDLMKGINAYYKELDSLADSSFVWSAVVKEITSSDNSAYKILPENELRVRNMKTGATKNAPQYWSNTKHPSVVEMLLDADFPLKDKLDVLSDVVRYQEKFSDIRTWEMPYQLLLDNGNSWSDRPPTSKSIFDASRDFDRRFSRFSKRTLEKEAEQAQKIAKMEADDVQAALEVFSVPGNMVEIPDGLYADALMSAIDKEYKQAEKTGTTVSVSTLFEALLEQRGGSAMHDVYRTDDRVLGMIAIEKMSGIDIAQILSGKRTVVAYDRTGAYGLLSRDTMVGVKNATNKDVQNYLVNHPRIASALVRSTVGVGGRGAYLQGLESPKDSLTNAATMRKVSPMPILMDHPGFGALVAVLTGTGGEVSRNMRTRYTRNSKAVANLIIDLADFQRKCDETGQVLDYSIVANELGLTTEAIEATGFNKEDGENLRSLVISMLGKYANELKDSGLQFERFDVQGQFNVDQQSLSAFFDVRQELNRAKIHLSTSIEGTETFQLALWMAMLSPKDKYTTIAMIDEADYEKFAGCMTSTGETFDPSMMMRDDMAEIVVQCPEGYVVQDNTSDRTGQQISSAAAYFVIKRDKGAEEMNMKAAKKGDDGKDSITKHARFSDIDFYTLRSELEEIASSGENGLMMARYKLANILLEENKKLGYEDLDLANYMCLADIMLVQTEEGIMLRSLEQVAAAIKWRMPYNVIDNANVDEVMQYASMIATECGTRKLDPTTALDGIHRPAPALKAGRISFGKRKVSSSFDRNLDLLKRIYRNFKKHGHSIIGKERASAITKANLKKMGIKPKDNHPFSEYDVLGIVGEKEMHTSPGPRSLWVINEDSPDIPKALKQAERYGITVAVKVNKFRSVPKEYWEDFIDFPGTEDYFMLPFFDMELNGSRLSPSDGHMGIFQAGRNSVSWGVESRLNEYGLGDSGFQALKHMSDTMEIHYSDVEQMSIQDLFPNLDQDSYCTFGWPDTSLIETAIINGLESDVKIDYGVNENSSDYDMRKKTIDLAIERYRKAYKSADELGVLPEAKPGDIIGWIIVESSKPGEDVQQILAPLVMFERKDSGSVPTSFSIDAISWGVGDHADITGINVAWTYNDRLDGHYVKMYEGAGCANKMLGMVESDIDLYLRNGIPLDYVYSYETTKNRRGGTNRRIKTMETLMFAMRCDEAGYNFASDSADSFPNDPELKELLSNNRLSREAWPSLRSIVWHADPEINAFVAKEVQKFYDNGGNPSDYLGNRFGEEFTNVMWEFEYMFEQNLMYEDFMLKYIHSMRPDLVPNGIEDTSDGYIFRVSNEEGMNKGCLQMEVPHESVQNPGTFFYTWENVFAGYTFFGEEFSGFHRPNVNGAAKTMEALNTMVLSGRLPNKKEFKSMLKWSTQDMGRYNGPMTLTWDGDMGSATDSEEE